MKGKNAVTVDDGVEKDCELEDKKEEGEIMFLNVEGDGVLYVIYEALWTQWYNSDEKPLDILVPDTVVFTFGRAIAWYYTKRANNPGPKGPFYRFHKKKDYALRSENILKAFLERTRKNMSDIVALFIGQCGTAKKTGKVVTKITYFNRDDLRAFLLTQADHDDGILQVFVDPKPSTAGKYHNSLVRCTWSPCVCLVERRLNTHLLNDTKWCMYERSETFEGTFKNSEEYPLTSITLLDSIQQTCSQIVSHYMRLSKIFRIKRMVLNFKFDVQGNLNLLWCESLRLSCDQERPAPALVGTDGTLPPFNLDNKLSLPSRKLQGELYESCALCNRIHPNNEMFSGQYSTMMAAYDEIIKNERADRGFIRNNARLKSLFKEERERMARIADGNRPPPPKNSIGSRPWREPPFDSNSRPKVNDGTRQYADTFEKTSFTVPTSEEGGVLAKLDQRRAMVDPMGALMQLVQSEEESRRRTHAVEEERNQARALGEEAPQTEVVPWFFRKIHPYMSVMDYLKVRSRKDFQSCSAKMCPNCYLVVTESLNGSDLNAAGDSNRRIKKLRRQPNLRASNQGHAPRINSQTFKVERFQSPDAQTRPLKSCLYIPAYMESQVDVANHSSKEKTGILTPPPNNADGMRCMSAGDAPVREVTHGEILLMQMDSTQPADASRPLHETPHTGQDHGSSPYESEAETSVGPTTTQTDVSKTRMETPIPNVPARLDDVCLEFGGRPQEIGNRKSSDYELAENLGQAFLEMEEGNNANPLLPIKVPLTRQKSPTKRPSSVLASPVSGTGKPPPLIRDELQSSRYISSYANSSFRPISQYNRSHLKSTIRRAVSPAKATVVVHSNRQRELQAFDEGMARNFESPDNQMPPIVLARRLASPPSYPQR